MGNLVYNGRVATYTDDNIKQSATFEYPNGTIFVALSGGLDSTVLIYLICKYITDLKLENQICLIPIHSVSKQLYNSLEPTQEILDDVLQKYPNVNISDLEVYFYDRNHDMRKNDAMDVFYQNLFKKYSKNMVATALTGLPKEALSWPVSADNLISRVNKIDPNALATDKANANFDRKGVHLYQPFMNNDKKMMASLFNYLNLPKEYIKKTWSCTMFGEDTKNFTEPCGSCYHCWEKKWAFGEF